MVAFNGDPATLTDQEFFNNAYLGLAAQGFVQCTDAKENCRYRSGPLACAVGQNIPDRLYHREMDERTYGKHDFRLERMFGLVSAELFNSVQSAHDVSYNPEDMKRRLGHVALLYDLTIPALKENNND